MKIKVRFRVKFTDLPDDCLGEIAKLLDVKSYLALQQVNRRCRQVQNETHDQVLSDLKQYRVPFGGTIKGKSIWKVFRTRIDFELISVMNRIKHLDPQAAQFLEYYHLYLKLRPSLINYPPIKRST